jgi:hypothetical protein
MPSYLVEDGAENCSALRTLMVSWRMIYTYVIVIRSVVRGRQVRFGRLQYTVESGSLVSQPWMTNDSARLKTRSKCSRRLEHRHTVNTFLMNLLVRTTDSSRQQAGTPSDSQGQTQSSRAYSSQSCTSLSKILGSLRDVSCEDPNAAAMSATYPGVMTRRGHHVQLRLRPCLVQIPCGTRRAHQIESPLNDTT